MTTVRVSYQVRPSEIASLQPDIGRVEGIQKGSWSEWAIEKVVASKADDKWPNVIARIITRFFVDPDDAAEFLGVTEDAALAILGRRPSSDAALRADAETFLLSGKKLRNLEPSIPDRIRAALSEKTGTPVQYLTRVVPLSKMIDACNYADGYIEKAEAYLGRGDEVAAICALLVNEKNARDPLHLLHEKYGILVEINEGVGEIDQRCGKPEILPEPLPAVQCGDEHRPVAPAPPASSAGDKPNITVAILFWYGLVELRLDELVARVTMR